MNQLKDFFDKVSLYFQTGGVTLAKNLTIIMLMYIVFKLIVGAMKRSVNRQKAIEKTIPNFIISLINIALMVFLVFYACVALFGASVDSFVTIASVFSLGLSLALQGTISSFANGILIIANKPFVEGEFVTIAGFDGTVVSITMFNTCLKTADGLLLTVPNSQVVANTVKNYSRLPTRRVDIEVPVAYGTDVETLKKVVLNVVDQQKGILVDPEPSCRLVSYGDSNLNFVLKVWVPGDIYWNTKFDLNEKILEALVKANISIDYNQYDIHIKDVPAIAEKKPTSKSKSSSSKKKGESK